MKIPLLWFPRQWMLETRDGKFQLDRTGVQIRRHSQGKNTATPGRNSRICLKKYSPGTFLEESTVSEKTNNAQG